MQCCVLNKIRELYKTFILWLFIVDITYKILLIQHFAYFLLYVHVKANGYVFFNYFSSNAKLSLSHKKSVKFKCVSHRVKHLSVKIKSSDSKKSSVSKANKAFFYLHICIFYTSLSNTKVSAIWPISCRINL